MSEIKYPFNIEFQTRVLAVIMRDNNFTLQYKDFLKPNYFDSDLYVDLSRTVFNYIDEFGVIPSKESLLNEVQDYSNFNLLKRLVERCYSLDLSDAQGVEKQLKDFISQQSWRLIYPRIDLAVRNKEFDKARQLFDQNMRIEEYQSHKKGELWYFEEASDNLLSLEPSLVSERKIATLIPFIDNILHGGASRGSLNILFSPKKTGKSIFLVNVAVAALYQKKNVLYVTMELSKEVVAKRTHTRITGIPTDELYAKRDLSLGMIKRLERLNGRFLIKQYPTGKAAVKNIEEYIQYLWQVQGFKVDVLIVDYLDLLSDGQKHDQRWQKETGISEDLRALSTEMDFVLWTVTQAGKHADDKEYLGGSDIKGSSGKAETADSFFALQQSEEQEKVNRATLSAIYIRDGSVSNRSTTIKFNKKKMSLTTLDE